MTDASNTDKPNVLVVFSDQQRASAMGCYYGDEDLQTPYFDACAGEGMRMDSAISNTPVCTPFRAMLLTGKYGHHTGAPTNGLNPDLSPHPTMSKSFQSAGYRCGYIGKWHLGEFRLPSGHPRRLGFDDLWFVSSSDVHNIHKWSYVTDDKEEIHGEGLFRPQIETDKAIEFISEQDGGKPWFLTMSWSPPHSAGRRDTPESYLEPYLDRELKQHPNTSKIPVGSALREQVDTEYAHYYGLTAGIDIQFGRLMAALEETGQKENTIVVFTSDHGDMLGSQGLTAKRWPYRESSQIPLIFRWPGHIDTGSSLSMPMGTLDVYPTLCGFAGIDVPPGLDGRDWSDRILGKSSKDQIYTYLTMHHAYVPWPGWRGVRTDRYSYARTEDAPWVLFDLENDPYEEHNLIGERRSLETEMEDLLQEAMVLYGDYWRNVSPDAGDAPAWRGPKQKMMQGDAPPYPGSDIY